MTEIPPTKPDEAGIDRAGLENLSEEERKVWLLLVEKHKASSIKPSDFSDLYDKKDIENDERYVSQREIEFRAQDNPALAEHRRRGELLEALLDEGIRSAKWMGTETTSITPSRYDDIHNGIDLILESIKREGFSHLALNIDMTSSPDVAGQKILDIKETIRNGELSSVKYFHSKRASIRGELGKIPKVIIGVDAKHLRDLCLARIEAHTFKGGLKHPANQADTTQKNLREKLSKSLEKIVKNIARAIIMREIEIQLIKFEEFARRNNKNEIADKYRSALETLERAKNSKNSWLNSELEERIKEDQVFRSIESGLKDF